MCLEMHKSTWYLPQLHRLQFALFVLELLARGNYSHVLWGRGNRENCFPEGFGEYRHVWIHALTGENRFRVVSLRYRLVYRVFRHPRIDHVTSELHSGRSRTRTVRSWLWRRLVSWWRFLQCGLSPICNDLSNTKSQEQMTHFSFNGAFCIHVSGFYDNGRYQ